MSKVEMGFECSHVENKAQELTKPEFKNGLPVISGAEFDGYYDTDIRAYGAESSATFNFQGYVRETRKDRPQGELFRDVLATNGLLKDESQPGIHVGTDGSLHPDRA